MKRILDTVNKVLVISIVLLSAVILFKVISMNKFDNKLQEQDIAKDVAESELAADNFTENAQLFIENIDTNTELILITELGSYEVNYSTFSDNWNKWLTSSEIFINVSYEAIVSIPTNLITFTNVNGSVQCSFTEFAFEVKSVEIINKNIITDRSIFGKSFSDAEKIAMEKMIINEIRKSVLSNEENMKLAKESVENYYTQLAKDFGTEIIFN